jgi:DNA mismatch repair protein MSH6
MDTILMCQKGKFYEMFLEDAYIVHRELDLKLSDRGRMPMVGVPEASFDMFASKLLALGYKIGRVDQMETAVGLGMRKDKDKAKGVGTDIVRRELR